MQAQLVLLGAYLQYMLSYAFDAQQVFRNFSIPIAVERCQMLCIMFKPLIHKYFKLELNEKLKTTAGITKIVICFWIRNIIIIAE